MFSHSEGGERRFTAATYRFLVTVHVGVSVAWLGVVLAKFVLALMAMVSSDPDAARALYFAMESLNVVFPPLVIASLLSGAALTLGTRWGLLEHYWVLTKLVLSVVVFVSGARLSTVLEQGALAALFAAHLLALTIATVLSQYKPWGTTPRILANGPRRLVHAARGLLS